MERFHIKYNKQKNILTIEVTEKIARKIIEKFERLIPIEMLSATVEIVDIRGESGNLYKNVQRYTISVVEDRIKIFFEAAMRNFIKETQSEIKYSDN